jgi:hypothetical protein
VKAVAKIIITTVTVVDRADEGAMEVVMTITINVQEQLAMAATMITTTTMVTITSMTAIKIIIQVATADTITHKVITAMEVITITTMGEMVKEVVTIIEEAAEGVADITRANAIMTEMVIMLIAAGNHMGATEEMTTSVVGTKAAIEDNTITTIMVGEAIIEVVQRHLINLAIKTSIVSRWGSSRRGEG